MNTPAIFSKRPAIDVLILITVCFLAYGNTLHHAFLHDDKLEILKNPLVRHLNVPKALTTSAWGWQDPGGQGPASNYYRPTQTITYALLYFFFGPDPKAFHLYKIFFHALGSVLVFFVAMMSWRGPKARGNLRDEGPAVAALTSLAEDARGLVRNDKEGVRRRAFFAALVFVLHPMHVESVTWIAGITDVNAAVFTMISFLLFAKYWRSARTWPLWPSGVFFFLALLSKETAAMAPLIFGAYAYLFPTEKRRPGPARWVRPILVYFVFIVIYAALRVNALGGLAPEGKYPFLSGGQVALNAAALLAHYLGKLILPAAFNFHHTFHPVLSARDLSFGGALMVIIGLAAWAWVRRRKNPAAVFGLVWTVLTLVPVLHCQKLGVNVFAERYLYLPSVGFSIFLSGCLWEWMRPRAREGFFYAFIMAVLCFYLVQTVERNKILKDDLALWAATVKASPEDAFVRKALGNALAEAGRPEDAMAQYARAVEIDPDFEGVHDNWGTLLAREGKMEEAAGHYREALRIDPGSMEGHVNLANVLAGHGRAAEAEAEYREAVRVAPDSDEGYNGLGLLMARQGKWDEARAWFNEALRVHPSSAAAHTYLGETAAARGNWNEALANYARAWAADPDYTPARHNAADALMRQGKADEAAHQYRKILTISPEDADARYNLGNILAGQGRLEEAAEQYAAVLKVQPEDLDARNNLAVIWMEQGRLDEAIAHFKEVLKREPRYLKARLGLMRAVESRAAGE